MGQETINSDAVIADIGIPHPISPLAGGNMNICDSNQWIEFTVPYNKYPGKGQHIHIQIGNSDFSTLALEDYSWNHVGDWQYYDESDGQWKNWPARGLLPSDTD